MNNKSKLNLFAAVVLRALLLILPGSACATAEDGQEIGVPQAMEAPAKGCFGAVLSPTGDNFYTLREGLLTQYQINSLKRVDSVAIDWKQVKGSRDERCRILITNDKSKLIVVHRRRIFFLDASTGHLLNRFEITELGREIHAAILNDNDLVILEGFHTKNDEYFLSLTMWDTKTFKLKRDIRDLGKSFGFFRDDVFPAMSNILGRIYLVNSTHVAVLNSKTYAPELTILRTYSDLPKASKNFKKLYLQNVVKVTDHLTGKQTTYDDVKGDNVLVFDQDTRGARVEKLSHISRDELAPGSVASPHHLSFVKGQVMVSFIHNDFLATLVNLNIGRRVLFTQYESGEVIALGRDQYFQLTPGARKYLMMKNSTGKIVPINDATFNKYHRKEDRL